MVQPGRCVRLRFRLSRPFRKCRRRHLHRHHIISITLAISHFRLHPALSTSTQHYPTPSAHRSDPSAVFRSAHPRVVCTLDSTSERILAQHSTLTASSSITGATLHSPTSRPEKDRKHTPPSIELHPDRTPRDVTLASFIASPTRTHPYAPRQRSCLPALVVARDSA